MPGCCPDGARERLAVPKDGEVVDADVFGVGGGDGGFGRRTGMLLVLFCVRRLDTRQGGEGQKSTHIFGCWRYPLR